MWINLCEKKRIACLQSCIWANHRRLERCILDSPMWWCFLKNMHRQWNQIGQHQHKCLIPTVKRGCWGGASFGCRRTWAPCKHFAFGEFFCLPECCGSNIWCNGWRSVTVVGGSRNQWRFQLQTRTPSLPPLGALMWKLLQLSLTTLVVLLFGWFQFQMKYVPFYWGD